MGDDNGARVVWKRCNRGVDMFEQIVHVYRWRFKGCESRMPRFPTDINFPAIKRARCGDAMQPRTDERVNARSRLRQYHEAILGDFLGVVTVFENAHTSGIDHPRVTLKQNVECFGVAPRAPGFDKMCVRW